MNIDDTARLSGAEMIRAMPKAELHVHVEGTIEGGLLLEMADRNGIELPFDTPDGMREWQSTSRASAHNNLTNFLAGLDIARGALRTERDYYDVAMAYFRRCAEENIVYAEVMFDPQQGIRQGVPFGPQFEALRQAGKDANAANGTTIQWIMSFQRDHPLDDAIEVLKEADRYREDIIAVGLDNEEIPGFIERFSPLIDQARNRGYHLTCHCDVNQPDSHAHIRGCLDLLKVERIDHGLNVAQDADLVRRIVNEGITLTACPTFYVGQSCTATDRLAMISGLLHAGARICLNSDDPAQFGSGYLSNVLSTAQVTGGFSDAQMLHFMRNAFLSAWVEDEKKSELLSEFEAFVQTRTSAGLKAVA